MTSDQDIQQAPLHDLLADLEGGAPAPATLVQTWLIAEGYYPGDTRVGSSELYLRFRKWAEEQGHTRIPVQSRWGAEMTRRLKSGRSNKGNFYYISRESVPDMTHVAGMGGGGDRGGSIPGGSGKSE
jgi:hypothetical protein